MTRTIELMSGWQARETPTHEIELLDPDGNIDRKIAGCSLETARELFMLGWDVGHIEGWDIGRSQATNSLRKLTPTLPRKELIFPSKIVHQPDL